MFKKLTLLTCLFCTVASARLINPSDIDVSKKGIVLGSFLSYERALNHIQKFSDFEIYIKRTTTTKKPYYVPFALNIEKSDLRDKLKEIKAKMPTAYITSSKRIKELATLSKNDKISDSKTTKPLTLQKSSNEKKISKNSESKNSNTQIINMKNHQVDVSKSAITIGQYSSFSDVFKATKKLNEYDLLIKAPLSVKKDFILYAVNIDEKKYKSYYKNLSLMGYSIKKTSQEKIDFLYNRYIKGDRFIKGKGFEQDDSKNLSLKKIDPKNIEEIFYVKYQMAKGVYDKGNFKKAIELFESLLEIKSDHIPTNFYLARAYYKMQNFKEASVKFEKILILDESNLRARLELALTNLKLGLNDVALEGFNIVLKDKSLPENVVVNIKRKIKEIEAKKKKHYFYGSMELGFTYDNNVDNASSTKTFTIPAYPTIPLTNSNEIYSDNSYTMNLNLNYMYKINDKYSISNKVDYTLQEYARDSDRLNDSTQTGIAREEKKKLVLPSYGLYVTKYNEKNVISTGIDLSKVEKADKDYSQTYGMTFSYQTRIFSNTRNVGVVKVYKKDYLATDSTGQKINENLDSNNYQFILGNSIPSNEFGNLNLLYSYLKEDRIDPLKYGSAQKTSDRDTHTLILNSFYSIRKTWGLNSSLIYSHILNSDDDVTFQKKRTDDLYNFVVESVHNITNNFLVSFEAKYVENNSNINIYSYDKQTYGLKLKYNF
jgi:tetratricopeptide (TPR) repeat protein